MKLQTLTETMMHLERTIRDKLSQLLQTIGRYPAPVVLENTGVTQWRILMRGLSPPQILTPTSPSGSGDTYDAAQHWADRLHSLRSHADRPGGRVFGDSARMDKRKRSRWVSLRNASMIRAMEVLVITRVTCTTTEQLNTITNFLGLGWNVALSRLRNSASGRVETRAGDNAGPDPTSNVHGIFSDPAPDRPVLSLRGQHTGVEFIFSREKSVLSIKVNSRDYVGLPGITAASNARGIGIV